MVKNPESAAPTGGIPPDKQAEIQLLLQQRDPSTLKCYQDVLDEKHTRAFKGSVTVEITVVPGGKASDVRITGGSLNNKEVSDCLIAKLKDFEYPDVPSSGTMQYVYRFEPAIEARVARAPRGSSRPVEPRRWRRTRHGHGRSRSFQRGTDKSGTASAPRQLADILKRLSSGAKCLRSKGLARRSYAQPLVAQRLKRAVAPHRAAEILGTPDLPSV